MKRIFCFFALFAVVLATIFTVSTIAASVRYVCTPQGCYAVSVPDTSYTMPVATQVTERAPGCVCGPDCPCASQTRFVSLPGQQLEAVTADATAGACASCGSVGAGDGGSFEGKPIRRIIGAPFRLIKRLRGR